MSDPHAKWMGLALEQAAQAEGRTRPNPVVGAVVVKDDSVLATGHHVRAGEPHAELAALAQLGDGAADGADLYVNLEPCCTHGRTPPCTEAIIDAGIARVFVGTVDTNPRHRDKGIAALREAGIEVVVGVCEEESRRLNAPYFTTMEKGRPLVVAKWAMSLDGKIATTFGDSAWISGEESRQYVHELRNRLDAVLVGTTTLVDDNPRLTCRLPEGGRDPVRVVLDTRLVAAPEARVHDSAGTIVVHAEDMKAKFGPYEARGARSMSAQLDADGRYLDLEDVLRRLVRHDIMSVLVEGGAQVLGSLFDAGLVDRVYAFVAPSIIGGSGAPSAVGGLGISDMLDVRRLRDVRIERFGEDVLVVGDL